MVDLLTCKPLNSFFFVQFNLLLLKENELNALFCTIHLLNYAHVEDLVMPE